MSPNEVAAMPSLHAAMPVLLFMIVISIKGWRWLPLIIYPIVGGVAWVYIGEHYAIDVLAGYALAVAAYGVFWVLAARAVAAASRWHPTMALTRPIRSMRPLPTWPLAIGILVLSVYTWTNPILS